MNWKIKEQCLNWNKIYETFWIQSLNLYCIIFCCGMPSLKKIFKNARVVLSVVWSITCSMHTNLEYLSSVIKNSFPWNLKRSQASVSKVWCTLNQTSNSQTAVWQRICCKFHSFFLHRCMISPFIIGQKTQVLALSTVLLVSKWETEVYFKHSVLPFGNNDSISSF